ncbi:MAG: cytochrome P450 [Terriglobia bacterium]
MKRNPRPPGPPGHLLIGNFPLGTRDPLQHFSEWARQYGDIFYYRAFTIRVFFLNRPEIIESVLVSRAGEFAKGRGLQANRRLFGNGLLTSEGDFWRRQRKLCQPFFHRDRVEAYGEVMVKHAQRMLDGWHDGEVRGFHRDMSDLTLGIVAKVLFGAESVGMIEEARRAVGPIMKFNTRGWILVPLLRYLPTPLTVRYRFAVRRLERIVHAILHEHERKTGSDDLLSGLRLARDENGKAMSERQLRDEVMTLLLAGHETTALALCWTFYLLARNPAEEVKLLEEIERVLGTRPPRASDLAHLPSAGRVVRESLRLYPPAYAIARLATRDSTVGGFHVPRGASLVMSQWVMHRDPRYFEKPEEFMPDRWTDEFTRRLPNFAYFPFGGGPRVCIGASFAMTEAVLLLVTILQRFHVELAPGQTISPLPAITLRPKGGIKVIVRRRRSAGLNTLAAEPGAL